MALAAEAHLAEGQLRRLRLVQQIKIAEILIRHTKADSFPKLQSLGETFWHWLCTF
jgi:hypothetical protein